jgi:hypothetical protein
MNGLLLALIAALVTVGAGVAYRLATRRDAPRPASPRPAAPRPVSPRPAASPPRGKAGGRFGAVQIRPRGNACRAAHMLENHRFLAKDAPALPLPECTAARCTCTFSKLPDRRTDGRRLDHGGLSASLFLATSRRKKRDRRRAAPSSQNI